MSWGGGYDLKSFAAEVVQPCVWVFDFDSTTHYEKCTNHTGSGTWNSVVHTNGKRGISGHDIQRTGVADCANGVEAQREYCSKLECGYSGTYKKPHVSDGVLQPSWRDHYTRCVTCSAVVSSGRCVTAGGKELLYCTDVGVCATCKYSWTYTGHFGFYSNLACSSCGIVAGVINKNTLTFSSDTSAVLDVQLTLTQGKLASTYELCSEYYGNVGVTTTKQSGSGLAVNSTSVTSKYNVAFPRGAVQNRNIVYQVQFVYAPDGKTYYGRINTYGQADISAPTHSSTSLPNMDSWSNNRSLSTTWFDGFTNMVQIGLMNNAETQWLVPYGNAVPNSTSFKRDFLLSVEAPSTGIPFKILAKDVKGNVGKHTITLKNIDALPPAYASISNDTTNWAKSKKVRLTVTDGGIGQVQFSLDNLTSYTSTTQSGTSFYKDYDFTTTGSHTIYYKDGLGNAGSYTFVVSRIDTYAPTLSLSVPITTYNWHDNSVEIRVQSSDSVSDISYVSNPDGSKTYSKDYKYKVTESGTYSFTAYDLAGNLITKTVKVDIDKIRAEIELSEASMAA